MSARVEAAAAAALAAGEGPVEVVGETGLARALRERIGDRHAGGDLQPQIVIDTTGDPLVIQGAMASVADLGTVVLAGPAPAGSVALDLYGDLHLRGLTVIGIVPGDEERR